MREVVIVDYLRTAQTRSRPKDPGRDWFHKIRADELLAMLLPVVLQRAQVESNDVDDFIVGCSTAVGEQWTYGGKTPLYLANLSEKIAAKQVDQQCGSSMAAIHIGFMEIQTGNADTVLVGGMEHMTRVPMDITGSDINKKLFSDKSYLHWDMETSWNMGLTAEKLFQQADLTKEELDKWAVRSHRLATKAQEKGFFNGEIMPIKAEQADGNTLLVKSDQAVRPNTNFESLSNLRPIFTENGVITAGNSSPLNASASAMLLMSKDVAKKRGLKYWSVIRSIGFAGVDPTIMGIGPVPASKKVLRKADLAVDDIDYWEINEAFSVVTLNCIKELGIDPEKVNIKGGGIAIGHPLGATGIRIVGTLARILNEKKARWGIASACVGGGQGVATLIERQEA